MPQGDRKQKPSQEPVEFLTRSRTEIARTLDEMARLGIPVTATLDHGELLFVTRILRVDAEAGRFLIEYSPGKVANSTFLAANAIVLHAELGRSHVALRATAPVDVATEEQPGIRLDFPEYLASHRQRTNPRFRSPPQMGMRCVVECPGFLSFELEVVDISLEGQGTMLSDPDIRLEPGMILKGCRIGCVGRRPVVIDVEIRYVKPLSQARGSLRRRVGCRFIGDAEDIADLVRMFSVNLDDYR
jgi:hypothetical protein